MFGLLSLFFVLTISYSVYLWWRYGYWKRKGIPSPPITSVFLGHTQNVQQNKTSVENLYQMGLKLKTKTYGLMEGGHRTLVTSDLAILNDVFVKKFENFHGRKLPLYVAIDQDADLINADVLGSQGLRWKRLRTIMNPSFTTGKLRHFEPLMIDSVDHLIEILRKRVNQEQDVIMHLNRLTMDVIHRVAFGRPSSHLEGDDAEEIVARAREVFQAEPVHTSTIRSFFTATYDFLPVTRYLFKVLQRLVKDPFEDLRATLRKEVESRLEKMQRGEEVPEDYIQMFLNAQADEQEVAQFASQAEESLERAHIKVNRKMTPEEIVGQCVIFLLAGYDTTANGLGFFIYEMAMNPEVQEKLYEEIVAFCPDKASINTEAIRDIPYLECCLKENLRKNPHVGLICARKCTASCSVAGGIRLEKGTDVRANVKAIHYDRELWGDDVDQFVPERFEASRSVDRHPLAFFAFGQGPRSCIGMRLALLEERITVIRLLQEFRIEATPSTRMNAKGIVVTYPEDVTVRLVPRQK